MSRTAEPHMFVRVVCDGEGVSAQESTDGLALPSSESPTSLATGRMGGDDAWGDLIARAWGGAEVTTMGRVGDAHDRCNTTTVPHSGAGCHWGRKGCDAPSDATPSCTAEVRHPTAPSDTGEIPSDVPALVSSIRSFAGAQPPSSSTRLHAGGRSNSCRTSRLRAPTTRIASLAGAGAAFCCSARDAISVDALYTDIHPSVAASHALPSTPPPRHALAASRHQQRVLRAVKLLDAVLDDSSVGRSGGAATRRLDALHQILMTLTDACGQPPASLSRATGAELRRLRKRLVQEALRGNEAPRMLRGSSTSSRMSARLPPPPTLHAAPHHGLEGDSEKDVHSPGTFRLESVADDVHCTKPCPSPAPDASSLSFASAHSDTPAPTAVAASWPVLPPPPPGSSELDPYLQSTHQFQQEIASLHQAQLRRLPLR
ncbi:hypothetical protein LtaPh_0707300 [Leishmania tarentolae]|uniref:Uncharacterized protein n=1 Tax=Leishmania tarentolae TaxID=5689 RepID=A0A640K8S2_LEITA|nr:hypothetical protein LtaPh_0707300 [Leishmania tarentolae]